MKPVVCGAIFLLLAGTAAADIIEWQDADGVRHYTNLQSEVPKEQQAAAQVVVDELARGARPSDAPAPPAPAAAPGPRREAEVVYDRSQLSGAYLEGLARGLQVAGTVNTGGAVQINGPLAVANAPTAHYDTLPYAYPLVTTSFDRGRSRHLTLRMLLQDQFALDRDGPYLFEECVVPPCSYPPWGVALNPFLPRGVPHGFPRQARVLVR